MRRRDCARQCGSEVEHLGHVSVRTRIKIPTPSTSLRAGSNVAKRATLEWGTLRL